MMMMLLLLMMRLFLLKGYCAQLRLMLRQCVKVRKPKQKLLEKTTGHSYCFPYKLTMGDY